MVTNFKFAPTPHIQFGPGKRSEIIPSVQKFGNKIIVLTGAKSFTQSDHWSILQQALGDNKIEFFHHVIDHEPSPAMIDEISSHYNENDIDAVVAIGGGSVLDAGKAVAAMVGKQESVKTYLEGVGTKSPDGSILPYIAVPTTSGTGSECTKNAVISEVGEKGFKKSLRHDNYVPDVAIVDPELTLDCPKQVTASSGMDAFTQLLESYLSTNASPMTDALAFDGLEKVRDSLEKAVVDGGDIEARTGMAYASMISGVTLANAGLGTIHGFASSLGGRFDIPHGVICGTLMEPCNHITVTKLRKTWQKEVALNKYMRVGKLFSGNTQNSDEYHIDFLVNLIKGWTEKFEIPRLSDYDVDRSQLTEIAKKTSNKNNPVTLEEEELLDVLESRY